MHASSRKQYVTSFKLILIGLFFLVIALFVLWRNGRRLVAGVAIVLFGLLATGWLALPLVDLAQPSSYRTPYDPAATPLEAFGARTAIVMLGGGTETGDDGTLVPKHDVYARIALAASLDARCRVAGRVCRVIVSGGNPQHHAASEADTYAPLLLRAGVPPADLVLENRSLTTWENARNVAPIVHAERADTLFLVTSAYHMPRAMLDFHRFEMEPAPAVSSVRHVRAGIQPRLTNLQAAEVALHELIGIAQFYVYRMIGWF
ncbi:uncharacterized SAM-binding protein YcdF (DUF218 family) [Paraburkholderia tropica]|uniref:Uncharacterized SAM-binding protein YcdF (DUF218 family) n=1 Tax=Paraburkholderia tropica TaxID=92647 RepID=A0ABX5MJL1_9BURK|nr:uncharacterized SAM-binding protein YcdF (DUF218 family) [Paraburkholderia tropica]PZW72806.1 uncharacterized SAM-binding protein YcdF (DUF218 family) [Paraburkholderia tropica]